MFKIGGNPQYTCISFFNLYSLRLPSYMTPFSTVIQVDDIWPMVHVFVPAILAIYTQNIWKFLTIIYVFESVEFLVSQIPGMSYWGDVGYDSALVDIVMGLLGYAIVQAVGSERLQPGRDKSRFAVLCPTENSSDFYKKMVGPVHVALAAGSTLWTAVDLDWMPQELYYDWFVFGGLYLLWAVLFGLERWAIVAVCPVVSISLVSLAIGYTAVVTFVTVVVGIVMLYWMRKAVLRVEQGGVSVTVKQYKGVYRPNYDLIF